MWIGVAYNQSSKYTSHKEGSFAEVKSWGEQVIRNTSAASSVVMFEAKFRMRPVTPQIEFLDIDGTLVVGENKPVNDGTAII